MSAEEPSSNTNSLIRQCNELDNVKKQDKYTMDPG